MIADIVSNRDYIFATFSVEDAEKMLRVELFQYDHAFDGNLAQYRLILYQIVELFALRPCIHYLMK